MRLGQTLLNGRSRRAFGAAVLLGAAVFLPAVSAVFAQPAPQPPPPAARPAAPRPEGPMPVPPPARPIQPGQPGLPAGHPPVLDPHFGRPLGVGADQQRPARPVLPNQMQAPPKPVEPKKQLEECPGHGPLDAPHHINWWHGMLMVNNERAKQGGFLNELLFRYNNEANPCDEKNEPPPFLASILNFGVLLYVIGRFGKKPVAEALKKRREAIMGEIENATRLRVEAEERLADLEDKFDRIEQTLAELKTEYAAQAEAEKKFILAEAMERRERMKRDAEFRIEQERKGAKVELLQEAVLDAVQAAEQLIAERATAQDHERLLDEYLASVPAALVATERGRAAEGAQS